MLTPAQQDQLLRPINPRRVLKRGQAGRQFAYLAQHDVRAMLIRIFGFGGFNLTTNGVNVIVCEKNDKGQWEVSVMVTMTLHIPVMDATYSETAVGSSTQPSRGEALDMATKTGSSDAMKRCAMNLGDQFGLSLYENGSTASFVKTLIGGGGDPVEHPVTSLGDEENLSEQAEIVPDAEAAAQVVTSPNVPDDVLDEAERVLADAAESPVTQLTQPDWANEMSKALVEAGRFKTKPARIKAVFAIGEEISKAGGREITVQGRSGPVTLGKLIDMALAGNFVKENAE